DFMRYAATVWMLNRERLPVLRYDLAVSLLVALVGGAAIWFGPLLWPDTQRLEFMAWFGKKPRDVPLYRMLVQGAFVVVVWGVLALVFWRAGLLKLPPREE